ncbi:MAG: hypothetical protein AB1797_03980 [bacterium]
MEGDNADLGSEQTVVKWGSLYLGVFAAFLNGFITAVKFWGAIISIHLAYIICARVVVTFIIFYLLGRIIGWVVGRYVPLMVEVFTGEEEEIVEEATVGGSDK